MKTEQRSVLNHIRRVARQFGPAVGGLIFSLIALLAGGSLHAQAPLTNYTVLHSFGFTNQVGYRPAARLLKASDGAFYGTTEFGGRTDGGTVFRINQDGSGYTVLHNFEGEQKGDGESPIAGLIEGSDGILYGTTVRGGAQRPAFNAFGTVFKIRKDGTGYTLLRTFYYQDGDAHSPHQPLVQGSDGTLYGTTIIGRGAAQDGSVFRINTNGSGYAVLHRFNRTTFQGHSPGAILLGTDSVLYGTCYYRDSTNRGTVFRLNTDGNGYEVIHNFDGDGAWPHPQLIEGSDGALYGTTTASFYPPYGGTVFKVNKNGSGFGVLNYFPQHTTDFGATIMEGTDGVLYGTTDSDAGGLVFRLNKDGNGYGTLRGFTFGRMISGYELNGPLSSAARSRV